MGNLTTAKKRSHHLSFLKLDRAAAFRNLKKQIKYLKIFLSFLKLMLFVMGQRQVLATGLI